MTTSITLAVAFLVAATLLVGSLDQPDPSAPSLLPSTWDALDVGDVLAAGTRDADGACVFGPVELSIAMGAAAPGEDGAWGEVRRLSTAVDEDACTLVVAGKTTGPLSTGVVTGQGLLAPEADPGASLTLPVTEAALAQVCGKLKAVVWTEAAGPNWEWWEWITRKTGELTFCHDGSQAWSSYDTGNCEANDVHAFDVDSCTVLSRYWGPGSTVYRRGDGSYSQDPGAPPSGDWVHSLGEREEVGKAGNPLCTAYWIGSVPHTRPILECTVKYNEAAGLILPET